MYVHVPGLAGSMLRHGTGVVMWTARVLINIHETKVQMGLVWGAAVTPLAWQFPHAECSGCLTAQKMLLQILSSFTWNSASYTEGKKKYQKSKNTKVCQRAKRETSYFFLRKTSFDSFPSFLLFSSPAPLSSLWVSNVLIPRLKKKKFMFVFAFLS